MCPIYQPNQPALSYHQDQTKDNEVHPAAIPGVCSELTVQKKNRNRISLFVDGEFVSGFFRQVILDFRITVGQDITEELYLRLKLAEVRHSLKERCFNWLGRRAHGRSEIKQKALAKDFPGHLIDGVLDELESKGYLDDQNFALMFAKDKTNIYHWGPQKIRSALYQKGIEKRYIEEALNEAVTNNITLNNLFKEVGKGKNKLLRVDDPYKRKKKMVDFLVRKGYPLDVILPEAENLLKIIEDEES